MQAWGHLGVGPAIGLFAAAGAAPGVWATLALPGAFRVAGRAGTVCAVLGAGLVLAGGALYVKVARRFLTGFRPGLLVTDGPFARVRHPMYACWLWFLIPGAALLSRSWAMGLAPLAAFAGFRLLIVREERALQRVFGDAWVRYAAGTPRIIPRLAAAGRRKEQGT